MATNSALASLAHGMRAACTIGRVLGGSGVPAEHKEMIDIILQECPKHRTAIDGATLPQRLAIEAYESAGAACAALTAAVRAAKAAPSDDTKAAVLAADKAADDAINAALEANKLADEATAALRLSALAGILVGITDKGICEEEARGSQ